MMEELREKLIKSIEENGRCSSITIQISHELDEYIVQSYKKVARTPTKVVQATI